MEKLTTKSAARAYCNNARKKGQTVALVPTMGYLHRGHLNLIKIARKEADVLIVSIYVNPTQFSANEDFGVYPRNLDNDMVQLRACDVDAVFQPDTLYGTDARVDTQVFKGDEPMGYKQGIDSVGESSMVVGASTQPQGHCTYVQVEGLKSELCGVTRPHFFIGVATVVTKLFNIIRPDVAVFGSKDFQQLAVIKRMVHDLDMDVRILAGPTVRESDGLAMSSRNARLSADARKRAVAIYSALQWAAEAVKKGGQVEGAEHAQQGVPCDGIVQEVVKRIEDSGGRVDYVKVIDDTTLKTVDQAKSGACHIAVAAFYEAKDEGTVRLIDNVQL